MGTAGNMPDGVVAGLGKDPTRNGLTCTVRERDVAVEAGLEDEVIGAAEAWKL